MNKIKLLLAFGLLLPCVFAQAQESNKGKSCFDIKVSKSPNRSSSKIITNVYDDTGKPVPAFVGINGVFISGYGKPIVEVSVMPGKYSIRCTFVGMTSCGIHKVKIRKGEIFNITFNLKYTEEGTID